VSQLVRLENVAKHYGPQNQVTALSEISFSIDQGEYVTIMGPSGSGKSTLLSILGAMNPPSEGEMIVDDIEVYGLSAERQADFRREYLGFIFQQLQLVPYLTAIENVMLPLVVTDVKDHESKAGELLERVGLGDKFNRLPSELSGGEQGRVAIARAVVNEPPILLADEPTGSLDSKTGDEILTLFGELHKEGQTIIMVTHNAEAGKAAERLIQIKDGRIVEDGKISQKDRVPAGAATKR
jgi:putative ABC transport system ATP-binding protein